ncbi:unnamed protein product [Nippostrongylus brasiliensis]|uniref:G_PROTEIN_RECEP_F1_2 domain-containing protein n=1 Tax=Nippostrongylus brasiliensis TaxID=27835 RepID=A0A0N4YU87_NIPBR|nr:unnamed protein product [Nippostrongylus brasiliensis]
MENTTGLLLSSSMATEVASNDDMCSRIDDFFLEPRFWLAVVFGITISIISIIFNSFVFVVFVTSKQHRGNLVSGALVAIGNLSRSVPSRG